jgi:hypothetical protein
MKKISILLALSLFLLTTILSAKKFEYVKVIKPNGGGNYYKGNNMIIEWQCSSAEATGRIFLTRLKGGEVATIHNFSLKPSMDSSHEFTWRITSDIPEGSDYKIGVEVKYATMKRTDYSDNVFSIKSLTVNNEVQAPRQFARIKLISPNGGETIYKGNHFTVEWETPDPIGNPKLALLDGDTTVFDIFGIIPEGPFAGNKYRYSLEIENDLPNSHNYKLKIFAAEMRGSDISDRAFTITNEKITVTSPSEGQSVRRGGSITIRFNAENITQNLKVWVDGLNPGYVIAENLPPTTTSVVWNDVPVVDGVVPGGDSVRVVVSTMDLSVKGFSGWLIITD